MPGKRYVLVSQYEFTELYISKQRLISLINVSIISQLICLKAKYLAFGYSIEHLKQLTLSYHSSNITTMATETITLRAPPPVKENTAQLLLHSYEGFTYREVSLSPPRNCTEDEIPIVDLSGIDGDLASRREVAKHFLSAAEQAGFFYIKNHGVPAELFVQALEKTKEYVQSHVSLYSLSRPRTK